MGSGEWIRSAIPVRVTSASSTSDETKNRTKRTSIRLIVAWNTL